MGALVHDDVFRRLCRTKDLIHASYAETLSVDDLARAACLSPYHFLREFARAFGATPHAYLTKVRLDQAKTLLRAEHLPVTDVCLEVGFSSLGSFSTLFAKATGQPPSAYRRAMTKLYPAPFLFEKTLIPYCFFNFFGPDG